MKGLLEDRQPELETGTHTADEIELVVDCDRELRELAHRCRQLLAQAAPANCPPGHWLG
jgi:hypothetical protein